jgi:hypothetical protein
MMQPVSRSRVEAGGDDELMAENEQRGLLKSIQTAQFSRGRRPFGRCERPTALAGEGGGGKLAVSSAA